MKLHKPIALAMAALLGLSLAACGSDDPGTTDPTGGDTGPAEPITLTVSGWSLETTPEFQNLADAFMAANSDIKIEITEYDANDYETLMLTDMSAGKATDIITVKQAKFTTQWATGGQLLDVTDVVTALPSTVSGAGSYAVDGVNYAAPYRQDSWVLFYNQDLFDAAGIDYPDGTWTWDDYADVAKELTTALADKGAKGTYEHSWQSTLQGFAQAQTPGANITGGEDYTYLKPYYERVIDLQTAGAQETYGTVTTNKLTYQGQFGKQQAAMMPMGSWYVATLVAQQKSGDADTFKWGIAPAPQFDASTTGLSKTPVTFGDPTGMAIYSKIDASKLDAAKAWLNFVASETAGVTLAEIGIVSSVATDAVTNAYFAQAGMPTDDLSKFAMSTHKTNPENPQHAKIAAIQTALGEAHTAIMSANDVSAIDPAIEEATAKIKDELS
jgi:multiple sugar transport system substrate-binding protein